MKVLIIGGSGSLGSSLARKFSGDGYSVTVFSRDPHKQLTLGRDLPSVNFVLGDIVRPPEDFTDLCFEHDFIINAAALKHVDLGERHAREFVAVNILGAINIAEACKKAGNKIVLLISTDKAVDPINLYGKTKAVAEDIFTQAGYSALRYGNVVNSKGSFLESWMKLLETGKPIVLRKPDPTRFFMTIDYAVSLVNDVLFNFTPGKVYIPRSLKAFSINNVATALELRKSIDERLLPGEKRHEVLLGNHEQGIYSRDIVSVCEVSKGNVGHLDHDDFCSATAYRMTDREIKDAFLPLWHRQDDTAHVWRSASSQLSG